MATTEHFYTGNNSTTDYSFTFPYLKTDDLKVTLDTVATTAYSLPNSTTVRFNTAPGTGVDIHIYRDTDVDTAKAIFAAGSSIRAVDLNNNEDQALYSLQENQGQLVKTTDIKDSAVNSAKILDGTIVNADINASAAIAGTKVSPNFGSQAVSTSGTASTGALGVTGNITVSGTVDGRDVAADGTKLDTVATNANNYSHPSHPGDDFSVDTGALTGAVVVSDVDVNVTTDGSGHVTDANGAVSTRTLTLADLGYTGETNATADQTITEIKSLIASSPLDASHLDANSVTTSEIADAELTTLAGMQAGTASKLAGGTALTADLADLNQVDGLTKQTTISDSDASFPTSGAVVDYVAGQIAPIGGLEVIATDAAFPNTQPAAGVVISIADAGGLVVDGSGSSTTARTVGGSTVTINGINSSYNSSTVTAGIGFLVSSTGSGQIYNFHKSVIRDQDILSISTDINDFANRYRVGSSNPSSSLDAGDLFFNTTSGKLLVYNGSTSAWEEAQSVGNFYINTISSYSGTGGNSASFNGSAYRFVLSNPPTNAEQLLVSVNGVVQKPVAGTSQPSEGFSIDGSSIIFSSAPASGSDYFIITIGSTVNIGTPSNNTVTNAILQSGCVDNAKVATDAAISGSKLADDSIAEVKLDVHNAPSGTDKFLAYTSNGMEWAVPTDTNTQLSFANDANNRVVTGDGSGGLNGEANLTFDGNNLELGPAGDARLILHSDTDTNSSVGIVLKRGANDTYGADGYTDYTILSEGGHLIFTSKVSGNSDEERLRIDSNGRLLLGTTTEGHVDADDFTIEGSANTGLSIRSGSSNYGNIFFSDGTSGNDEIRGYIQYDHANNRMYFGANASHEVSILNGGGISFNGDTAAANALDDYEEGTFTPTLQRWNGSAWADPTYTTSPTTALGRYTKVGNVVHVALRVDGWQMNSGVTEYAGISGLPFSGGNTPAGNLDVIYQNAFATATATSIWINSGTTLGTTNRYGDGNTSHNTWGSSSSRSIVAVGSYFTN